MRTLIRWTLRNSGVAIAYFILGRLGLELALPPGYVSAIWPAAGMAFAVSMLWGPRQVVAGIWLGATLTNATIGGGFHIDLLAVVIAMGSALQASLGGLWLRRILPTGELEGPESVFRFSIVGVASSVIAATVGNVALLAHGYIAWAQVPMSFATWWLGDAFGVQIFGPLSLLALAPNATWRRRRLSVGLPLALSFMLCGLIYYFVTASEEQQLQQAFGETVAPFETEMHSIDRIHGQALRQLAASYNVREQVPGPEMLVVVEGMMKSLPAFRAISWTPVLSPQEQQHYKGVIQHPPGFIPATDGLIAPVSLIYPQQGNETAIGLDVLAQPQRAQALRKAMATGKLSMTESLQLSQDAQGPGAVLLMAPVSNTLTRGVISGVIDLRQIDKALEKIPGIVWELRETTASQENLVYKSSDVKFPAFGGASFLDRHGVYRQLHVKLADREWHILLHVSHKQLAIHGSNAPLLVLLMALLTCGVFSTFALIMSTHRERVESTVQEKTADLNAEIERRSETQLKLEDAKAAAEQANLAKSQFLATMSHEIRTPMNGILGMAQLLLMDVSSEAQRKDYARTILSSGKSLLSILNDILDFSKIEAGKLELAESPFAPSELVSETTALFRGIAREKGLSLNAQGHMPPGLFLGDPIRVRQMLSNLIGNAIKFSSQGAIDVSVRHVGPTGEAGAMQSLEFCVADQGTGIPADMLPKLFQPFSQVDGSATRRFGGTGLGLSIVKQLAEQMGGSVGVESQPGVGSRFWFVISVQRLEAAADAGKTAGALGATTDTLPGASTPPAVPDVPQTWVLIVEDNRINQMVVQGMLSQLGLAHRTVDNGEQAVEEIRKQLATPPMLVLMDCQMPVMDGYEATLRIRRLEQEAGSRTPIRIVALTASAYAEDTQRCKEVGMDAVLTKPLAYDDLLATVKALG